MMMALVVAACGDDDQGRGDADSAGLEVLFPDASLPDAAAPDVPDTTVPDTSVPDETGEVAAPDTIATLDAIDDTTADSIDDTQVLPDTLADSALAETLVDTTVDVDDDTAAEIAEDTSAPDTASGFDSKICTTDVATLGNSCTNAFVIGRPNAKTGFGHASSTVGAGNDSDFPQTVCGDSFGDRFYMIYLEVGEQLTVNANPDPASYDLTFGLYRGAACETPITCVDNDVSGTTPDKMLYQAVEEGWHAIVVDGRNTNGSYTVVVTLDCHEADCGCH